MKRKNKQSTNHQDSAAIISHFFYRLREGLLLFVIAFSLFAILSLATYHRTDPGWSHIVTTRAHIANAGGRVGAWLSDLMLYIFGYLAFMLPIMLTYSAWLFFRNRHNIIDNPLLKISMIFVRMLGFALSFIGGAGLVGLYFTKELMSLPFQSGGILGSVISTAMMRVFNETGSTLALITFLLIGITLFSGMAWTTLLEKIGALVLSFFQRCFDLIKNIEWKHSFDVFKRFKWPSVHFKWNWFLKRKSSIEPEENNQPQPTIQTENPQAIPAIIQKPSIEEAISQEASKKSIFPKIKVTPKLSLLDSPKIDKKSEINKAELENRSREVEMRLADFGVQAKVVAIHPGPVITRYELELAAGTKVSKITNLAKDLARSFSVTSVRVVEVIPGKSVIGLELPNPHRLTVTLQEILSSSQYQKAHSWLSLGLGKDIAGHPVVVDLAKMPHLLVAGTTGSGKSVCLNAMLLSLLYKCTPQELRLILIDPKMLELSVYDGVPHLLTPVVTDMRDAASALRWCVMEMERRYRLMASLGVRNIAGYNAKIRHAKDRGSPLLNENQQEEELVELPKIVVLADEFADMMVVVGKKVETLIARLAQKARAAGIHLILATQRPSVDVITGLIKANIPTRIAFQVSSKVDSRTILDQQGAEQLLGYGDMLYLPPGSGIPVRVHGAFVGDDEVHRVVKYLKQNGEAEYVEEILNEKTSTDYSGYVDAAVDGNDAEQDEVYDEAVKFVTQVRRVSVSSIQRRFKIGYNRAARIVEAMETAGVVSKMENNGTREVLAPPPVGEQE